MVHSRSKSSTATSAWRGMLLRPPTTSSRCRGTKVVRTAKSGESYELDVISPLAHFGESCLFQALPHFPMGKGHRFQLRSFVSVVIP